jgi:hypothetical protein
MRQARIIRFAHDPFRLHQQGMPGSDKSNIFMLCRQLVFQKYIDRPPDLPDLHPTPNDPLCGPSRFQYHFLPRKSFGIDVGNIVGSRG